MSLAFSGHAKVHLDGHLSTRLKRGVPDCVRAAARAGDFCTVVQEPFQVPIPTAIGKAPKHGRSPVLRPHGCPGASSPRASQLGQPRPASDAVRPKMARKRTARSGARCAARMRRLSVPCSGRCLHG